ncbi:hypothetical protein IWX50DRAFT_629809 [Phyllosticta citricarpa]
MFLGCALGIQLSFKIVVLALEHLMRVLLHAEFRVHLGAILPPSLEMVKCLAVLLTFAVHEVALILGKFPVEAKIELLFLVLSDLCFFLL